MNYFFSLRLRFSASLVNGRCTMKFLVDGRRQQKIIKSYSADVMAPRWKNDFLSAYSDGALV